MKNISHKLIAVVITTVAVAFCICGLVASQYFYNILEKQAISNEHQKLTQVSERILQMQEELSLISESIAIDSVVQQELKQIDQSDSLNALSHSFRISSQLFTYLNGRPYICNIYLLMPEKLYCSHSTLNGYSLDQEDWFDSAYPLTKSAGFTLPHQTYVPQTRSYQKVVSYLSPIYDIKTGKEQMGCVMINIDFDNITSMMNLDLSVLDGYALLDGQELPILQNGSVSTEYLGADDFHEQEAIAVPNGNTLIIQRGMKFGWNLVSEISSRRLQSSLRYVPLFFFFLFVLVMSLLLFLLTWLIKRIISPIGQLSLAAQKVGHGELDFRLSIHTGDEFEALGKTFNYMIEDISNHIEKVVQFEKTAKEMEISRLLMQINPHFIYNTLNSIVYMAQTAGNVEIAKFSQAFIVLLQDTLSVKEDLSISLRQELKNIANYLVIQEYRYPERFETEYKIEECVKDCKVPNVFLQPLVENSIFHGICAKEEKGHLVITARLDRDRQQLICTVEDDGLGISRERVDALLSKESQVPGQMRKVGLFNLKQRIEYLYGPEYGMRIESEEGCGTKIIIWLPYRPCKDLSDS